MDTYRRYNVPSMAKLVNWLVSLNALKWPVAKTRLEINKMFVATSKRWL